MSSAETSKETLIESLLSKILDDKILKSVSFSLIAIMVVAFPFALDNIYLTNIMISCLIYIVLGLGLNIVVGLAGLLDLGFVAFYAIGAYAYALLNMHFQLGFWTVLPLGALLGAITGLILGFPVLRLRGDYLAIVTQIGRASCRERV